MNIKPITNILSSPRLVGPAVFVGVGLGKSALDYNRAKPEKKKKVFAKDAAILAGSVVAFTAVSPLTKKFCRTEFIKAAVEMSQKGFKKIKTSELFAKLFPKKAKAFTESVKSDSKGAKEFMEKQFNNVEYVLKQSIAGTINTFAGILGAIYANEFMHKYVLNKPYFENKNTLVEHTPAEKEAIEKSNINFQKKMMSNNKVFKNFDYINKDTATQTANRVFATISDLPSMKVLEKPMIALTGFSVANTKGYHNKFKKTSYELLANTMIPTLFVSVMSLIVGKRANIIKYPALVLSLVAGTSVGSVVANHYKTQINEAIDGIDMKYIVV